MQVINKPVVVTILDYPYNPFTQTFYDFGQYYAWISHSQELTS